MKKKEFLKTIGMIAKVVGILASITGIIIGIRSIVKEKRKEQVRYVLGLFKEYKESYRNGAICGIVIFRKDVYGEWWRRVCIRNLASGEVYEDIEELIGADEEYLLSVAFEEVLDVEYEQDEETNYGSYNLDDNTDAVIITTNEDGVTQIHPGCFRMYGNLINQKVNDYAKELK